MSNIKEQVCAEIERRKNKAETMRERGAYLELLSFLDTLPDEPVTDCHDLTEAKEEYLRKARMTPGHEWMTRDIEDAFKAGAEWMKRKMMEWAVECSASVCKLADKVWVTPNDEKKFHQDVFDHFIAGDKVRIIILPEEG